jgi:hypothetical protein
LKIFIPICNLAGKDFKMSQQYFKEKKFFFIKMSFLSFYLNSVCKNTVCDVGLIMIRLKNILSLGRADQNLLNDSQIQNTKSKFCLFVKKYVFYLHKKCYMCFKECGLHSQEYKYHSFFGVFSCLAQSFTHVEN